MQGSLFQRNSSLTLRLFFCLVICCVLMWVDHRYTHLQAVRHSIDYVVSPLRYMTNLPFAAWDWTSNQFRSHQALLAENERLTEENLALTSRQQKMDVIQRKNQRLRKLLGTAQSIEEHTIVAELVRVALDPFKQQVTLNRGTNDCAYSGQPVLGAEGIMGQIVHTGPFTSTALLLTDSSHAIPVQSNRTGLRTIAQGTGHVDQLELLHIPNNADIELGDLVISSGLAQRFPAAYPVAYITDIQRDPGQPFAKVMATPTAALDRINEVLIMWPSHFGKNDGELQACLERLQNRSASQRQIEEALSNEK